MSSASASFADGALDLCSSAARYVASICTLRALPFVAQVIASRAESWRSKALAVLAYALLLGLALGVGCPTTMLLGFALGSIYYFGCSCAVPACASALRAGHITRGSLFAGLVFMLLLLPGALAPAFAATGFLVLGWELLLSAYSYCRETARHGTGASFSDCLFFLLVDPTVVYSARSERTATVSAWEGLRRAAIGVGTMFIAYAALRPAYLALRPLRDVTSGQTAWLCAVAFALARFFAEYAAHSGLADIQIGLMRQRGYLAPERYLQPFLARSPADFWQRWNRYLALWLKQYVFAPLVRRMKNVVLPVPRMAAAVLLTLLASGLLHDGYAYAADHMLRTRSTQFFAANGCALAVWSLASRARRWLAGGGASRGLGQVASRTLFVSGMLGACWVWG